MRLRILKLSLGGILQSTLHVGWKEVVETATYLKYVGGTLSVVGNDRSFLMVAII
jgi:hypothetical protein